MLQTLEHASLECCAIIYRQRKDSFLYNRQALERAGLLNRQRFTTGGLCRVVNASLEWHEMDGRKVISDSDLDAVLYCT